MKANSSWQKDWKQRWASLGKIIILGVKKDFVLNINSEIMNVSKRKKYLTQ